MLHFFLKVSVLLEENPVVHSIAELLLPVLLL